MRALANGLLGLMTLIFLAARLAPKTWAAAPYVQAFAEAGMVGACADWFAVTALFRRPLGLPIPHTAILPRNKARIGQALGEFISHNFLDPRLLDQKLLTVQPARRVSAWLADPQHVDALARRASALAPSLLTSAPALAGLAGDLARRLAQSGPLAPLASKVLAYVWRDAGGEGVTDRVLVWLSGYLKAHLELVQIGVQARTWPWLPKWVDRLVADHLANGVIRALADLRDPANAVRAGLNSEVETFIARLADDPSFLEKGEILKARFLNNPGAWRPLAEAWSEAVANAIARPSDLRDLVEQWVRRGLGALGQRLADDPAARDRLDLWIRVGLRGGISPGREAIGRFVAQIVSSWDAEAMAQRIELQVGRDLQYIRINGALVGGLVGLALYSAMRLIH